MSKYVKIPTPGPVKVTGAAARAVKMADDTAAAAYARLERDCGQLAAALSVPAESVDATALAEAAAWEIEAAEADAACSALVARWRGGRDMYDYWPMAMGPWAKAHPAAVIQRAAMDYRDALLHAGVPMEPLPETMPALRQYWQDAAARGC
jgi:hypothetical protein